MKLTAAQFAHQLPVSDWTVCGNNTNETRFQHPMTGLFIAELHGPEISQEVKTEHWNYQEVFISRALNVDCDDGSSFFFTSNK